MTTLPFQMNKCNPMQLQHAETTHTRSRLLRTEHPDIDTDRQRIFRYLKRIHVQQCHVCSELYPPAHGSGLMDRSLIFGCCRDCWLWRDDLDEHVNFSLATPHIIALNVWQLLQGCRFDLFVLGGDKPPLEFDYLLSCFTWFGTDRITHSLKMNNPRKARGYIHPDSVRWEPGYGWLPNGTAPSEFNNHRQAIEAIHARSIPLDQA